jgi:hypothetical protein
MWTKFAFGAAAALFVGFSASAHAYVLNTLGNTGDSSQSIGSTLAAESFEADGNGIGDVVLALSTSTGGTGNIVVSLRANHSGAPGTLVDAIATISASSIPVGVEAYYQFYNLPVSNLISGTQYWLQVAHGVGSSSTNASVDTTAAPSSAIGDVFGPNNLFSTSTSTAGQATPYMVACISDDNSCGGFTGGTFSPSSINAADSFNEAVPEPAGLAVLGVGLVAVGWSCRRAAAVRRSAAAGLPATIPAS